MKKRTLITAFITLSVPLLYADNGSSSSGNSAQSSSASGSSAMPSQEIQLSKLMQASVASKSGEDLGQLEDLAINPKTGKIDYVILGRGGVLGVGEKRVPVPWQAVNITSEKQFTVNVDKEKLKSAPTVDRELSQLNRPNTVVTIYRFFAIPMNTGGAESQGGSQTGGGSSSQGGSSSPGASGSEQGSSSSQGGSSAQPQSSNPK